ncbi:uncharacterized protein LOC126840862 [Adelges cooleyi]|uniref:uncharacterized protein LOC126840862 n=1 Tax=Adelges cooleyi TaxID=133065 RepID=UPI00217FCE87|nr:uncharacterized protein LOC126840862 [Adelges cooleyi]
MYLGICTIFLCLWHFHTVLLTNSEDDSSAGSIDSRMRDEFQRIYVRPETEGQSSRRGSTSNANDSDDDVMIVGSRKSRVARYFYPVDQFWQYEKCRQLKLQLVKYLPCNQTAKILRSPSRSVEVQADGGCFYRTLSYWVSGTENNHLILRLHVLEIVRTDQRIVEFLGAENYREHLIWLSQNTWATETEIVAATLLLNTPIYVYSHHKRTWDLFDQNRQTRQSPLTKEDKCIYIQHVSRNHYNLVTDVKAGRNGGSIRLNPERAIIRYQEEEIRYFNPINVAWQQEMCNKWELILEKPFKYDLPPKILKSPKKCVEMEKDKNSFFRGLSYWLSGIELNHRIIRNRVAQEIIFNRAIQELYNGYEFISFEVQNNWATKIEIIASAVLLNTSIFIYSHDTKTWDLYNKNIIDYVPVNTSTDKCIYLMQSAPNEYDVVQEVEDYVIQFNLNQSLTSSGN